MKMAGGRVCVCVCVCVCACCSGGTLCLTRLWVQPKVFFVLFFGGAADMTTDLNDRLKLVSEQGGWR